MPYSEIASGNALVTQEKVGTKWAHGIVLYDSGGNIISTFGGTGGTSQADRSSFTDGSGLLTPIGGVFNDTPTDPTEDQVAAIRINAKRGLHVTLYDAAGIEVSPGAGVQYTEGDVDTTFTGTIALAEGPSNTAATLRTTAANNLLVDGSTVTQPISAASLPLPAGAATSALQTQPGVDIGDVTINNAAGASAVNIQDGGNSITVDGSVTANPTRPSTGTRTQIADTTVEGVILASNANRLGAQIYNDSTVELVLGLGTTVVTTSNYTVKIFPNGYYEVPAEFTGQIRGLWPTDPATGGAKVTELTA